MNTALVPVQQTNIEAMDMFSYIAHSLADSSIAMYKRDYLAFVAYAEQEQLSIYEAKTLESFRDWMIRESTKSPLTINRMLASTKRIAKEMQKHGMITRDMSMDFKEVGGANVHKLRDRMKHSKSIPTSKLQMQSLINAPNESTLVGLRDKALLYTLVSSGVRAGELADLLVSRVHIKENGAIIQVMGKKDDEYRDANLSPDAYLYIQEWLIKRGVESPYVFVAFHEFGATPTNRKMSAHDVLMQVTHYAKSIGLDHITPHSLRRFLGTTLTRDQGIRVAQISLGHKSINTTAKHYVLDSLTVGVTDNIV